MKNLKLSTLALATLLISQVSMASIQETNLDCAQVYAETYAKKAARDAKIEEYGSNTYVLSVAAVFTGSLPIVAGMMLGGGAMVLYAKINSNEEKVAKIQEAGSKSLVKFTKKMKRKVSSSINETDVLNEIQEGLNSGEFCKNYPKLASMRKIQKHVEAKLKSKF